MDEKCHTNLLMSGGPLQVERDDKRYEIVGIVSWGNGCARPYYPGKI